MSSFLVAVVIIDGLAALGMLGLQAWFQRAKPVLMPVPVVNRTEAIFPPEIAEPLRIVYVRPGGRTVDLRIIPHGIVLVRDGEDLFSPKFVLAVNTATSLSERFEIDRVLIAMDEARAVKQDARSYFQPLFELPQVRPVRRWTSAFGQRRGGTAPLKT